MPSSRKDEDIISEVDQHTVCWRYYGTDSPNKGQVSIILKTKEGWNNLGVWTRGPISLHEIRSKIAEVLKK
jgi:hypothetical protein